QLGDLSPRRLQRVLFGRHGLPRQGLHPIGPTPFGKAAFAATKRVSPLVEKLAMHTQLLRHGAQHLAAADAFHNLQLELRAEAPGWDSWHRSSLKDLSPLFTVSL